MNYISRLEDTPVGGLTLVSNGQSLTGVVIDGQRFASDLSDAELRPSHPVLQRTTRWLDEYFAGKCPALDNITLAPSGTSFQQMVWSLLLAIPYGTATTYGMLARKLSFMRGSRMSSQAVGGAVGRNPIAILVPCHRVIGANGRLVGYDGGLEVKRTLLELEKIPYRE